MTYDPRFIPIIPQATASHAKFYPYGPFISITLAQWAVESAYGAAMSGRNNCFGIKATPTQINSGGAAIRWTKEFLNGRDVAIQQYFANYPTLEACFDAHAKLLISHHYIRCMAAPTPQDYAMALHYCGYATAPDYAKVLISIMDHNNLYRFDRKD